MTPNRNPNPTIVKSLDYIYFNIYNHCYQRSFQTGSALSRFQAMYLFSFCVSGWVLFLQAVYLRTIRQSWFSSKGGAMTFSITVYLVTALVIHHIFITNERDQKILTKYESNWNNNPNKKRDLLFSFFVMSIPYVLMMSMSLVFPRPH
jgi:hypothetical protein